MNSTDYAATELYIFMFVYQSEKNLPPQGGCFPGDLRPALVCIDQRAATAKGQRERDTAGGRNQGELMMY